VYSQPWEYTDGLTGILSGVVAGEFEFVNRQTGDCLTAGSGGQVSAESCDGADTQLWTSVPGSSGSELRNASSEKCLESSGGAVATGTCSTSSDADLWSQDGTA
jgi:hypothetical protein